MSADESKSDAEAGEVTASLPPPPNDVSSENFETKLDPYFRSFVQGKPEQSK
jgi:hypothetical protein